MNVDDSYQELGLAPGSSDAEVKAAWRRLVAQWHPDRNDSPKALRKMQRINRAWEEIRRARAQAGAPPEAGPQPDAEPSEPPAEAAEAAAAPATEHTVEITLEDVVTGCTRELRGALVEDCAECAGSGLQAQPTRCSECGGSGRIAPHLWFGWMSPRMECGACQGHGETRQGCSACDATGKAVPRPYRCRVQVPPGARPGDVLEVAARVQGQRRKHPLALRVHIALQPHEFFTVADDGTLSCERPVDGFAWIANRWMDVPTPRGLQQMKLRRDYLSYRIKGAGLPWGEGGAAGDCLVTVVPIFPAELSRQQEAAIDRLVASNSGSPTTPAGGRLAAWNDVLEGWQARLGKTQGEARAD